MMLGFARNGPKNTIYIFEVPGVGAGRTVCIRASKIHDKEADERMRLTSQSHTERGRHRRDVTQIWQGQFWE